MKLTLTWLYPKLMNIYGDYGNVLTIKKRCEWRGIDLKIIEVGAGDCVPQNTDLVFMGGGQDFQQTICAEDLLQKKDAIFNLVESEVPALFVCGGYQLMGHFYHPLTEKEMENFDPEEFGKNFDIETIKTGEYESKKGADLKGIGLFDIYTVHFGPAKPRLIGNVALKLNFNLYTQIRSIFQKSSTGNRLLETLVGFENHGGRTYPKNSWTNELQLLGKIVKGFGNNGEDQTEGAIYKNAIGSYLHGPILPKNPHLADFLIVKALKNKSTFDTLQPLDDSLALLAHSTMLAL